MSHDGHFSVDAAREAAARNELHAWVAEFLASPGSDNALLGKKLSDELERWTGPVSLPISRLQRLAGPPDEPVLVAVDDDYWDDRVDDMAERIEEDDWEPAPVIVSYRNGDLVLEDGNHRVESLRRAGREETWAIVGFESDDDRSAFESSVAA